MEKQEEKISVDPQTGFQGKVNSNDIFLTRLTNEKIEKTQIANIAYEKGAINVVIKMIMKGYSEQLQAKNFNILDEMDRFFERHKLPQLIQEETDNLNSPVPIKEIEFVVQPLQEKRTAGPYGFTGKFYQTLNEEIIPISAQPLPENTSKPFQIHLMKPALPLLY